MRHGLSTKCTLEQRGVKSRVSLSPDSGALAAGSPGDAPGWRAGEPPGPGAESDPATTRPAYNGIRRKTRARQGQVQAAEPVAAGREAVVTVSVPQSAEEAHSALLAGEELETGEVPGPSPAPVCGQRLSHRKPEWDWRGRHHAEPADAADAGEVRKESSLALPGSTAPASVPVALADSNSDAARRGVRGVSGEGPAPTSSAAPAQGRDQYCVLNF